MTSDCKFLVKLDGEEIEVHTLYDACLYFAGQLSELYKAKCHNEHQRKIIFAAFCGYLVASGKIECIY